MNDFWLAFLGGLASGIVLIVLATILRRFFRRHSEGSSLKLSKKELRPLVVMAIGLALIFVDAFLIDNGGYMMGIGGMILIWGVLEFL